MSEKTAEVQEKVQTVADESSPKGGALSAASGTKGLAKTKREKHEGRVLPVPRLLDGVYGLQDADGNLCAAPAPDSAKPNSGLV